MAQRPLDLALLKSAELAAGGRAPDDATWTGADESRSDERSPARRHIGAIP
jgi:hypothetical protein